MPYADPNCPAAKKSRRKATAKWRAANPKKAAENCREWAARNPEARRAARQRSTKKLGRAHVNGLNRAWRVKNPARNKAALRRAHLRRRYNITPEEWEMLAQLQDHRCALCERNVPLVTDHCRTSNVGRALLCRRCNNLLGLAHDDLALLAKAAAYLLAFTSSEEWTAAWSPVLEAFCQATKS